MVSGRNLLKQSFSVTQKTFIYKFIIGLLCIARQLKAETPKERIRSGLTKISKKVMSCLGGSSENCIFSFSLHDALECENANTLKIGMWKSS